MVLAISGETANTIIEGLTIRGGRTATDGAGMRIALSSPTILGCVFEDNIAERHGGGIASILSSPTITDCLFLLCHAGILGGSNSFGGGVYMNGGSPQISDSVFANNNGLLGGGGAYVGANTNATITGSAFNSNSAYRGAGGALLITEGTAQVSDCEFLGNWMTMSEDGVGAGVAVMNGAEATFSSSQFSSHFYLNTERSDGGAAWISDATASFVGCGFTSNQASRGGAIYAQDSTLGVVFCGFNLNYSDAPNQNDSRGGAIYTHSSDVVIGLSQFTGNISRKHGGAVATVAGTAEIEGCVFTENVCIAPDSGVMGDGGAIRTFGTVASIDGCAFVDNTGNIGGAVNLFSGSVTVSECTFSGNSAGYSAGGMFSDSGNVHVFDCEFVDNYSPSFTGGLSISAGPWNSSLVERCVFDSNESGFAAGGALIGDNVSVVGCEFTNNTSPRAAGAATYISARGVSFIGCSFTDNTATLYGGAAATLGLAETRYINCVFTGNSAPFGQGAVYASQNPNIMEPPDFSLPVQLSVELINCLVVDNAGGGVVNNAPATAVHVSNSIIRDNPLGAEFSGPELHVAYSNIQGGAPGTGNIDADPLFINPAIGNYRLGAGSPCIDAGSNMLVPADVADINHNDDFTEPTPLDYDGSARFMNTPGAPKTGCGWPAIVDMGPFETPGVPASDLNIADMNGDGLVNAQDLGLLLGSWGPCTTECCLGDLNGDGVVNAQDLAILLGSWGS